MIVAIAAPTAPASVGVKAPENSPPKTPIISSSTGQVSLRAATLSPSVTSSCSSGASSGFSFTRIMTTAT